MRSSWLNKAEAYFNRDPEVALYAFDSFGKDHEGRPYYDLSDSSQADRQKKKKSRARVTVEFVEYGEDSDGIRDHYGKGPLSSGVRPKKWALEHNKRRNFDPRDILEEPSKGSIRTNHRIERHMSPAVAKKQVIGPNAQDNLAQGIRAAHLNPEKSVVAPAAREEGTKVAAENPDFSNGTRYEGEDFMAFWVPLIDTAGSEEHFDINLQSRSTIHELMRAVHIQAGLSPLRAGADIEISGRDPNGQNVKTVEHLQLFKKLVEVMKTDVGIGFEPFESATAVAQYIAIIEHARKKPNEISSARKARGVNAYADHMHDSLIRLANDDGKEFDALAKDALAFIYKHCAAYMDYEGLDRKYKQWADEGHGVLPAYTDGMHQRLRSKLDEMHRTTSEMNEFFSRFSKHRHESDAEGLAAEKAKLIDHIEDLQRDFVSIRINAKNGHWNPALLALKEMVAEIKGKVDDHNGLATASPKNPERIEGIVTEIQALSDKIRNHIKPMLDDESVSVLRQKAADYIHRDLELTELSKDTSAALEPNTEELTSQAQAVLAYHFDPDVDPFDDAHTDGLFPNRLREKQTDRERAALPFMVGARNVRTLPVSDPFKVHISFDPKSTGPNGAGVDTGEKAAKQLFSDSGTDPDAITDIATMREEALREWTKTTFPNRRTHSSLNDARVYDAVARNPEFINKKGGGYRLGPAARLERELIDIQLKSGDVVFDHGWWRSEHEVQKRIRCIEMQLGAIKRPAGNHLNIYTAPEDLKNLPANPTPDSLYETILPLAQYVNAAYEFEQKVPAHMVLGLGKLMEIHAMLEDPDLMKTRIKNAEKRIYASGAHHTLTAYRNDERRSSLGAIRALDGEQEPSLYQYFSDQFAGLLMEPALIRGVPTEELQADAHGNDPLGRNYRTAQKAATGKRSLGLQRMPKEGLWHINTGSHNA